MSRYHEYQLSAVNTQQGRTRSTSLNLKVIEGPSTVEGGELRANDAGGLQCACAIEVLGSWVCTGT